MTALELGSHTGPCRSRTHGQGNGTGNGRAVRLRGGDERARLVGGETAGNYVVVGRLILINRLAVSGTDYTALPTKVSTGTPDTTTVCISDDNGAGVTIDPPVLEVDEGLTKTYTVRLTSQPSHDMDISVTPRDSDLLTVDQTSLRFNSTTWADTQEATVTSLQDPDADDTDTLIEHRADSQDSDYQDIFVRALPITVLDQDFITVSFMDLVYEVREGSSMAAALDLSQSRNVDITVPMVFIELGGITEDDYTGMPSEIVFPAGNTRAQFVIEVHQDDQVDPGEAPSIGMDDMPERAERGLKNTATVEIRDDDTSALRCPTNPGGTMALDLVAEVSQAGEVDTYTVRMDPFRVYIVEMMGATNGYDALGQDTHEGDLTLVETGSIFVNGGSTDYGLLLLPEIPHIISGKSYAIVRFAKDGPKTISVRGGNDATGTYQLKARLNDIRIASNGYAQFNWDGGPQGYVMDPPADTSTGHEVPMQSGLHHARVGFMGDDWYSDDNQDWCRSSCQEGRKYRVEVAAWGPGGGRAPTHRPQHNRHLRPERGSH